MVIQKTDDEIYAVLDTCIESDDSGSKFPGMSYEEGVRYAIDWITGNSDEHPFDD